MSTLRQYLQNLELDRQLAEEGYVVVSFLNEDEVRVLKKVFEDAHPIETVPFYATAHHQDSDFRKEMSFAISNVIKSHVEEAFENCDLLGASFISKTKNDGSLLQPHQDWNIVDEEKYRSFNLWIPLVDLTEENGAIEILPKSHNWIRGYRQSSIDCAYRQVHDLVWNNMEPLYMKAGEALIYDHALLHASKANRSSEKRIACASGIIPKEAQMYLYWKNEDIIEQYECSPEFFMTQNIFDGPTGLKKVAELEYDFPTVSQTQFYGFIGKEPELQKSDESEVFHETSIEIEKQYFWDVYTPMNILREIHHRMTS
ncbi:MAG: phytanoyl-CoA dioxygenase family protein [Flavobacteriales bacterium]|nr:phytanoyl-CoA dioxygenase family protein [Flavobacteriales bacterium]